MAKVDVVERLIQGIETVANHRKEIGVTFDEFSYVADDYDCEANTQTTIGMLKAIVWNAGTISPEEFNKEVCKHALQAYNFIRDGTAADERRIIGVNSPAMQTRDEGEFANVPVHWQQDQHTWQSSPFRRMDYVWMRIREDRAIIGSQFSNDGKDIDPKVACRLAGNMLAHYVASCSWSRWAVQYHIIDAWKGPLKVYEE